MKRILILMGCLFVVFGVQAQNSYAEAIQQGDRALRNGQYKTAMNKYFSAEAFDPSKKDVVRRKVNIVFDRIEALRVEAVNSESRAEAALTEIKLAREETQVALQKAEKLVDAFYFYKNRFALAYGERNNRNVFYFIDKNGNEVKKLGQWADADRFGGNGYAQVVPFLIDTIVQFDPVTYDKRIHISSRRDSNSIYKLDTFGNSYQIAYDLKNFNSNVIELNLSGQKLAGLSQDLFKYKQLKTLLLYNNLLESLPAEIENLKNLILFDLSGNNLTTLPAEIGDLDSLKQLYLSNNDLTILPEEIGNLENLTYLNLKINQLMTMPKGIGKLQNLTYLNLERNALMSLPIEISNLQNLRYLYLYDNELTVLPAEIGDLSQLKNLDLQANQLTALPVEIGNLQNLRFLYLNSNELTTLPSEIRNLTSLENLNLRDNPISREEEKRIKELLPNCKVYFTQKNYTLLASNYFQEGRYLKAYEAQKIAAEETNRVYTSWYSLSWYALFINKPEEAINAAQKTLELNPQALKVETNLALGYLLNSQWEEAKLIYLKWKGENFLDDRRLCDEIFLQDIQDLEAAGIKHPDFDKVRIIFQDKE